MRTHVVPVPRWYWIVAVLALVWMSFGVLAWLMDLMMDEAVMADFTEAQRRVYLSRPAWIFAIYAVAVFSGFAGTIGLLLRRAWATTAFAVSLAAVVVQFAYTFLVMDTIAELGLAQSVTFPLVIFLIGVALLGLARHARRRGWLV